MTSNHIRPTLPMVTASDHCIVSRVEGVFSAAILRLIIKLIDVWDEWRLLEFDKKTSHCAYGKYINILFGTNFQFGYILSEYMPLYFLIPFTFLLHCTRPQMRMLKPWLSLRLVNMIATTVPNFIVYSGAPLQLQRCCAPHNCRDVLKKERQLMVLQLFENKFLRTKNAVLLSKTST